jgi:hypothetical protein
LNSHRFCIFENGLSSSKIGVGLGPSDEIMYFDGLLWVNMGTLKQLGVEYSKACLRGQTVNPSELGSDAVSIFEIDHDEKNIGKVW